MYIHNWKCDIHKSIGMSLQKVFEIFKLLVLYLITDTFSSQHSGLINFPNARENRVKSEIKK